MITHEGSLHDYTNQLKYVLSSYHKHGRSINDFDSVVIGGLGGSGIGSAIAKNWFFSFFPKPIETVNDYHLPAYVGKNTLVILNSYSGNTEETLSLFEEAIAAGSSVIVLSSGGKISELAKEHNLPLYVIESGFQPRMTIGYGLSLLLMILSELNGVDFSIELAEIIEKLEEKRERQLESAETIFKFFKSTLQKKFVIIADRYFLPVAIRFSQQLNENAKLEAFVHALPETNHNVLESYVDRMDTNFIFMYCEENPRVAARFDFLIGHLEMENNKVLPLLIPQYDLYTIYDIIYRTDWVSVHMANELGAPLMEVPMISELKEYLSNLEIIVEDPEEETSEESDDMKEDQG